jgi:hypothetical protein
MRVLREGDKPVSCPFWMFGKKKYNLTNITTKN